MSQNKEKLKIKLNPGKRRTFGGYSFFTGDLPAKRRHIESYLTAAREEMIYDLSKSEANLTAAQIILIDRTVCMLGIVRAIEEHIRQNSTVMKGEELAPSLKASYLSYNNSIRLNLQALGIKKGFVKGKTALENYLTEISGKSEEAKQKAKVKTNT